MLSIEDFGKQIKAKYPQYSSIADADVGIQVLNKYPQYKSKVTQTPNSPISTGGTGYTAPKPYLNNFLGTLGQGIATAYRTVTGQNNQAGNEQAQALSDDLKVVKAIHSPTTTPANKANLLSTLQRNQAHNVSPSDIDPGINLKPRQVVGAAVKAGSLALNPIDAAGVFGAGDAIDKGRSLVGTLGETAASAVGGKLLGDATTKVFDTVAPKLSEALEKTNLRLTPTQKANLGAKADDAAKWLSENKVVGTPEGRFDKVDAIYDKTEDTLQKFLKTDAKDVTVPRKGLTSALEDLKANYKNDADSLDINKQIDRAKETLKTNQKPKIAVSDLNEMKRSTYKNAYNQAGSKVRDDVEKAIGDVYRSSIEDATNGMKVAGKDIGTFNKEYGRIINAKNFLQIAKGRNQIGWIGRTIAGAVGAGLSEHFGGGALADATAFGAGELGANVVAGTLPRSAAAAGLRSLSNLAPKVGPVVTRAAGPLIANLSGKPLKSGTNKTSKNKNQ